MNEVVLQDRTTLRANWVNVILGIWMVVSPFVLGFSNVRAATWNDVATGLAVLFLALSRSGSRNPAPFSVLTALLGGWLIISAFVLAFFVPVAFWNNIVLGIIVAFSALASSSRPTQPARVPATRTP